MSRSDTRVNTPSALFAALGDPTRLRLVIRLSRGDSLSITELATGTKITRQAVTKHLRILEDVGLVRSDRVGRDRSWRIEEGQLAKTGSYLEQISAQWETRLERLRSFVEDKVR